MRVAGRQIFAAMLRDITPRVKAENALRQAVTARDDMIGIVSHDLRNPANAVKMLARSIIEAPEGIADSVVERVKVIHQAAAQIDTLIQDLLDVTRIEAGRLTVTPRRIALSTLLEQALDPLRALAEASQHSFEVHSPADELFVSADLDRVTQVISNIVGNALKFTPSGGHIAIDVKHDSHDVEIRVTDDGVGIPADQLPHVFDRFYQASTKARRHGAGLGLPIARGIIEAHGGTISISSEEERGTTVRFTLPLA
jgi:signal transduction histidine kinase